MTDLNLDKKTTAAPAILPLSMKIRLRQVIPPSLSYSSLYPRNLSLSLSLSLSPRRCLSLLAESLSPGRISLSLSPLAESLSPVRTTQVLQLVGFRRKRPMEFRLRRENHSSAATRWTRIYLLLLSRLIPPTSYLL